MHKCAVQRLKNSLECMVERISKAYLLLLSPIWSICSPSTVTKKLCSYVILRMRQVQKKSRHSITSGSLRQHYSMPDVHFVIDCTAFIKMQDGATNQTTTGIGAVIKRLCYLSRNLGVYYDLAYDSDSIADQTSTSILHLTLYGPQ